MQPFRWLWTACRTPGSKDAQWIRECLLSRSPQSGHWVDMQKPASIQLPKKLRTSQIYFVMKCGFHLLREIPLVGLCPFIYVTWQRRSYWKRQPGSFSILPALLCYPSFRNKCKIKGISHINNSLQDPKGGSKWYILSETLGFTMSITQRTKRTLLGLFLFGVCFSAQGRAGQH